MTQNEIRNVLKNLNSEGNGLVALKEAGIFRSGDSVAERLQARNEELRAQVQALLADNGRLADRLAETNEVILKALRRAAGK